MAFHDHTNMKFSPDDFAHLKIPLENIISATHNFDVKNVIGESTLVKRYKGKLLWSSELIPITAQRFNKEYSDELFWMEVMMLSSLRHPNLVSFVAFCDDNDEKIIILRDERIRGSLDNYLSDPMLLTWVRRLEICVGIANALRYIHYDESRDFSVIYRRIHSGIVLLNDNWEPKLCSFEGSMKIKASQRHHSFHNHTLVYVSGYIDPAYIDTKSASHKSDIHSFGVVMFELLDQENKYLTSVAVSHYKEKKLNEIIDWVLWNQMDSQSFNIFAEVAYGCLNEEPSERPNIDEIVTRLEKALELQLDHHNEIMSSRIRDLAHLKIPLDYIVSATNNFNEKNVVFRGRYERKYKGQLSWSGELIGITAQMFNKDRDEMFWTEVLKVPNTRYNTM